MNPPTFRDRRFLLPDHAITDERRWLDRRSVLRAMGFVGASAVLGPACTEAADGASTEVAPVPADVLAKFPAGRNPTFAPGRPLTPESIGSRHNNYYELTTDKERVWKLANSYAHRPWTVRVDGLCAKPTTWDVDDLIRQFDQEERHYRFRCVEAWSATIPWTGFPLRRLLGSVQPLSSARFVRFVSYSDPKTQPGVASQPWYPWPYFEGLRMDEAMHELTLLATGVYGKVLPGQHGAPIRLLTPWKYGFKSAKAIVRIELVAERPPTFWNKLVPDEYDFLGNVDPATAHPRWSQATERLIDDGRRIPTLPYNGYGALVAGLYR
jgi:sulfoxide reductase catalytic subunit YedY